MNNKMLAAIAVLTAGSVLGFSLPANSTPLLRTIQCADGTIFTLGDAITDEIACADHGGLSPTRVPSKTNIKANNTVPPIPFKAQKKRAR